MNDNLNTSAHPNGKTRWKPVGDLTTKHYVVKTKLVWRIYFFDEDIFPVWCVFFFEQLFLLKETELKELPATLLKICYKKLLPIHAIIF